MTASDRSSPATGSISALAADTRRRLLLLSVLGLGLVLGLVGHTMLLNGRINASERAALHWQDVSNDIEELTRVIVDLESAQRGYIITGKRPYLGPYEAGVARIDGMLDALAVAVAEDADARAAFAELRQRLAFKRDEIDMAIALMDEQGRETALSYISGDIGMALMDDTRSRAYALKQHFVGRTGVARAEADALRQQRDASFIALAFLCLAAALGAIAVLYRYAQALESEARAVDAARRAARENVQKGVFLANISHEIRTPMNAIFGFTQLLGDLVSGARERYYVQAIAQSGKALLALINDVLDLSKIEAGKLELNPQPVDLRETLAQVRTMFSQTAADKGLQLDCEVGAEVPALLELDPVRLRQVLLNLVGNALKFTQRGHVRVRAQVDAARRLTLEVEDSGPGIAPDAQRRIFDPFTQVGADAASADGSGLGLAIVKQLVELMDGEIALQSQPGRGSLFRIALPLRVAADRAAAPSAAPDLGALRSLVIVAVDDIELNLALLSSYLEGSVHRVFGARDAATGLSLVRELRPDIVLMDLRMPDRDGFAALAEIRGDPMLVGVKVIATTASSLGDEEVGLRRSFDGYLRKPITREQLFAEIARLVAPPAMPALEPEAPLAAETRVALAAPIARLHELAERARSTLSSDHVDVLLAALAELPASPPLQRLHALRADLQRAAAVYDILRIDAVLLALRDHLDPEQPAQP